uniref:Protein in glucosyltransferase n=1 Tax=Culex tarsalis TaxID=7177 RepID=A0A1Q3F5U8_CULTA
MPMTPAFSTPNIALEDSSDTEGVVLRRRSAFYYGSLKSLTSSPQAVAPAIRSSSPHPSKSVAKNDSSEKPEKAEKEKKKKEFNSSRQKKFSRHFTQVEDEKVLNHFSCALVSDILLQGHLYITQNYFAFYSNVFGYVTKLLIPTVSVIKISKEKTAKMFPNAVGVTTSDDRHVFGSFMSREAAYRLMCSVWRPVAPAEEPITQKVPDVEVSECSVEDDSSCSISGNESSSHVKDKKSDLVDSGDSTNDKLTVTDGTKRSLDATKSIKSVQKEIIIKSPVALLTPGVILKAAASANIGLKEKSNCSDTLYQNTSSSSNDDSMLARLRNRLQKIFPSDFGVIHVGIILAIVLALFSCFLMYKIHYLQTRMYSFNDFRWGEDDNMDVYAEVLRWQKQMQDKSTEEAQIVLNSNLEQIAKVRKSLETLSVLLHDSSKKYGVASGNPEVGNVVLESTSEYTT